MRTAIHAFAVAAFLLMVLPSMAQSQVQPTPAVPDASEFCGVLTEARLQALQSSAQSCCPTDQCDCESLICGGDSVSLSPLLLPMGSQPKLACPEIELPGCGPSQTWAPPRRQSRRPGEHYSPPPSPPPRS